MAIMIGIAAHSIIVNDDHARKASIFVEKLSECLEGYTREAYILLGGYWGIMQVVADEALKKGMKVIFFPPLEKEKDTRFPRESIVIKTGLSMRGRSIPMVRSSDVLVVLGGSSGTLLEAIAAYTEGVPIYALVSLGLPTDVLVNFSPYIDERKSSTINVFNHPGELAEAVCLEVKKRLDWK